MPADVLIRDILLPSIGNRVLVVHHADSETPFVDALVTHLRVSGGFIGISGIELVGPIDSDANEEARRRSDALRERYEAALELAAKEPLIHTISGEIDANGALKSISISGAFSKQKWRSEERGVGKECVSKCRHR